MLHRCAFCDYSSFKLFNVQRHTTRRHTSKENVEIPESSNVSNTVKNENHLVALKDQFVALKDQFVALEDQFVAPKDQFVALRDQFVALEDQFVAAPQDDLETPSFECEKCNKIFTLKKNLARHMKICTGVDMNKCPNCEKVFANRRSKYKHKKHCKESPTGQTIIQNINNTNIQNINNTTNIQNNVNYVVFNISGADPIEFKCDHIEPEVLKQIFSQPDFMDVFSAYSSAVLDAPENRIAQKTNMSRDYSLVYSDTEKRWKHMMDFLIYYNLARGISSSALVLTDKHKKKVRVQPNHRENLRNIQADCELSPTTAAEDDETRYMKVTRDCIRALKCAVRDATLRYKHDNVSDPTLSGIT